MEDIINGFEINPYTAHAFMLLNIPGGMTVDEEGLQRAAIAEIEGCPICLTKLLVKSLSKYPFLEAVMKRALEDHANNLPLN